jgi:hypothetical protein
VSNPILEATNPTENVQIGTIWKGMAVIAFMMLSFTCVTALTWGVWVTVSIKEHDTKFAVLEERTTGGKDISQSVNVGAADADKSLEASAKTWLTTKDVAARIGKGVTERTVINYIENGMIEPTPRKNGKSWEIAEHFRIIPNDSENCGEIPQGP